jgi:uncharacterized protein
MELDRNDLEVLGREECLRLMQGATVGRLGMTVAALPVIVPVTFVVVDGAVVIRTGAGTKLRAAAHHQVACFEVDDIDVGSRSGWSVLVTGRLREVSGGAEMAAARSLGLEPWIPGADRYLRLDPELVSGRRLPAAALAGPISR